MQVFLDRLNDQQSANMPAGWKYVLPTESQWEYACRAGTTTAYSWGNDINSSLANYNWDGLWDDGNDFKEARDVGQYAPNPWGFYDMQGNVLEYTADWYQETYPIGPVIDPSGPETGSYRSLRGGFWGVDGVNLRSATRWGVPSDNRDESSGFRLAYIYTGHKVELNSTVDLEMLWVEPGTFTMGSPITEAGRDSDETEHNVTLTKGFYLGKYEVTQAQYEAVMTGNTETNSTGNVISATPSYFANNPNRPVERVSWDDIQVFLDRLNDQQSGNIPTGWEYFLPTEAQWEYACRAGTTTAYSWGNDINSKRANYSASGLSQTSNVGNYAANAWGFFDMHGNVWEWTSDWYTSDYQNLTSINPSGPLNGEKKSGRGGTWLHTKEYLRSAHRYGLDTALKVHDAGFRVGLQKQ
jgi:formylglycine-generating enzyme required for sulfatase activity